jgi:A/G-specific adenine glycosylase
MATYFTQQLLSWNKSINQREMPWKGELDPYKIWLSEVILQQTRVEQGRAYYEKFIHAFPTIQDLAKAKDEKVFKLWEGLGYYNRCRNLLHTARYLTKTKKGVFPDTYDELLSLKGIGPYTAAAIASFAFNLPYAVVDGNVFRVLSRFYGIATPIDSKEGLAIFNELAFNNLAKKTPGAYNQAIMDFGATVCKPAAPDCVACNLASKCVAYNVNQVNQLPMKLKRITKKKRYFDFLCFNYEGSWMIQQRGEGDVWNGLYQFYLLENDRIPAFSADYLNTILSNSFALTKKQWSYIGAASSPKIFKQLLTHQTIEARFIAIKITTMPKMLQKALWVKPKQFAKYAFPKIINDFLVTFHHGSALE